MKCFEKTTKIICDEYSASYTEGLDAFSFEYAGHIELDTEIITSKFYVEIKNGKLVLIEDVSELTLYDDDGEFYMCFKGLRKEEEKVCVAVIMNIENIEEEIVGTAFNKLKEELERGE